MGFSWQCHFVYLACGDNVNCRLKKKNTFLLSLRRVTKPAPHYQSIVPFRNNNILQFITENGGSAVAENLGISDPGQTLTCIVLCYLSLDFKS